MEGWGDFLGMITRLDSWQRRVFLLEGDIQEERWHDRKTGLDYHVRGRLMQLSRKGVTINTRLVLEDDSDIVLRGMYHRETTRHALERAIIMSYREPSVYPRPAKLRVLLEFIHRMDITHRCIHMLQRYPEGLANWMVPYGSPNKSWFRQMVGEEFIHAS